MLQVTLLGLNKPSASLVTLTEAFASERILANDGIDIDIPAPVQVKLHSLCCTRSNLCLLWKIHGLSAIQITDKTK